MLRSSASQELFGLKDISQDRKWDYSLPTVTEANRYTERLSLKSVEPVLQSIERL